MPAGGDLFTGRIPHFFDLLGQLDTSIPVESQWVLWIQRFPKKIIEQVQKYESYSGADAWTNVGPCFTHATADPLQNIKGCIFAQEVEIPGESIQVERAGEGYRGGYIKGPLTTSRGEFANFRATFLETNLSFGDLVLRPWTIMTSHLGLLARENETPDNKIKTNINVFHLAKAGYGVAPIIRKQFNFYNCVPISISSETYGSSNTEAVKTRQVEFLYSYYTADVSPRIIDEQPQGLF